MGPLIAGGGSDPAYTCAGREVCSLITHFSIIFSINIGRPDSVGGIQFCCQDRGCGVCWSFNAFFGVAAFRPTLALTWVIMIVIRSVKLCLCSKGLYPL